MIMKNLVIICPVDEYDEDSLFSQNLTIFFNFEGLRILLTLICYKARACADAESVLMQSPLTALI